jgi:hypothetical protein
MLHDFLTVNRDVLISNCRDKVAKRLEVPVIPPDVDHGVPLFLHQLVETLRKEESAPTRESPEPTPAPTDIGRAAALHGADLLRLGYTVDQVVHNYGDICQAVTELAVKQKVQISADDFRTLNRCLDNAIADAVTAHGNDRETEIAEHAGDLHKRFGTLADKQRRLVDIAIQTFAALKTGKVGLGGQTGTAHLESLVKLRELVDNSMSELRMDSEVTKLPLDGRRLKPQ